MDSKKTKILFITPGPEAPNRHPEKNLFHFISSRYEGHVISTTWGGKPEHEIADYVAKVAASCGSFDYRATPTSTLKGIIRSFRNFFYFLREGIKLARGPEGADILYVYGMYTTGIAGVLIKMRTKKKLIIEIPGHPFKAFSYEQRTMSPLNNFKSHLSHIVVPWVLEYADHIKMLYPGQLEGMSFTDLSKVSIYHSFTPIHAVRATGSGRQPLLFFLGFPWYLKGVDVLIKAFHLIADEFPDVRLQIAGWCTDKSYFEKLRAGHPRIDLGAALSHEEAMRNLSECAVFVLPSRTEAMGRVLLEAMALKKTIVASRVDGIPHYVEDGVTGLLFESENEKDLADKLRRVLADPAYADELARKGQERVFAEYSEKAFLDHFDQMIMDTKNR